MLAGEHAANRNAEAQDFLSHGFGLGHFLAPFFQFALTLFLLGVVARGPAADISGPATTAAVGMLMIPAMINRGYDKGIASAVTASEVLAVALNVFVEGLVQ